MFPRNATYAVFLMGILGLFTTVLSANESSNKFIPGVYEALMLAVDHDGNITGSYRESQGVGVVKTCAFYLSGKDVNGLASISSWRNQVFTGELKNAGNEVILKIEKAREHPGCRSVLMPEITKGIGLTRTSEANWISLKLVKIDRANLYSGPSLSKKTKSYFIKHDVLGVLSVDGEWVHVEYPREGKKPVKGWMQMRDLTDLVPPKDGQSAQ